ncbi:MAG: enoyl-CoA hydratase-related protein [Salinivirgaceae bacterium]|jgi:methylglutaconyl-CoA hydratase|nr:enoyl-CoA hydratase-related protein [Salinivirgaceae bacterium]
MTDLIQLERNNSVLTVRLNRENKKNALNGEMINALMNIAKDLQNDKDTDIVVLKGKGDSFCAGADLCWFKKAADLPEKERIEVLKELSVFLRTWSRLPQTTITIAHGFLYGGALGLMAVSDFVILDQNSNLRLSEVLLGLIPASIAPYLIKRMGFKRSKALMLSAEAFNAQLALAYGLADKIGSSDKLLEIEQRLITNIQRSSKETRYMVKEFLFSIVNKEINEEVSQLSAKALSDSIDTDIAREFIEAFAQKNSQCDES